MILDDRVAGFFNPRQPLFGHALGGERTAVIFLHAKARMRARSDTGPAPALPVDQIVTAFLARRCMIGDFIGGKPCRLA